MDLPTPDVRANPREPCVSMRGGGPQRYDYTASQPACQRD